MNVCPSSVFQTECYWRVVFYDVGACASPGNMSIRVHMYVLVGILFHRWHKINGNVYTVKIIKKLLTLFYCKRLW